MMVIVMVTAYRARNVPILLKKFPFDKEYAALGRELDSHLSSRSGYDKAINLVLVHIMLSLSSESNIYNPQTNRPYQSIQQLVKEALKALDLNSVFINYCEKTKNGYQNS